MLFRSSKRAYLLRSLAVCFGKVEHMSGHLFVSVEVLGRTNDENGGRAYTVGPQFWIRHFSPLLGRLLGQKEPREDGDAEKAGRQKPERYKYDPYCTELVQSIDTYLASKQTKFSSEDRSRKLCIIDMWSLSHL